MRCCALLLLALAPLARAAPATTQLVVLGTGTPNADPARWGPAVAVVIGDHAYLVDAGVGVVRRAAAARQTDGMEALRADNLRTVFLTHLHSDHTLGLPDLMLSPWVLERDTPLAVYGPPGTRAMVRHIEQAWREDIDIRLNGLEPQHSHNYRGVVHEVLPGPIYADDRVEVDAFAVAHGSWQHAYGYRFRSADRTIVVSGDTRPTPAIAAACAGCDVLLHEVYSAAKLGTRPADWQTYHRAFHTSTVELAAIAKAAKPKLLVLYHQLYWGASDADLVAEIRAAGYSGRVVSAKDLDVY